MDDWVEKCLGAVVMTLVSPHRHFQSQHGSLPAGPGVFLRPEPLTASVKHWSLMQDGEPGCTYLRICEQQTEGN